MILAKGDHFFESQNQSSQAIILATKVVGDWFLQVLLQKLVQPEQFTGDQFWYDRYVKPSLGVFLSIFLASQCHSDICISQGYVFSACSYIPFSFPAHQPACLLCQHNIEHNGSPKAFSMHNASIIGNMYTHLYKLQLMINVL